MKKVTTNKKISKNSLSLILLCFLVYFIAYLARYSYSSNINRVIEFFSVTRASAGSVGTCFFIAYGVGQVFHGLMCKKYNSRYAIFLAMIISAIVNLSFTFLSVNSFDLLKVLWFINGFAQAVLWSSLIRLLNESLPTFALSTSVFIMALPVSAGTFVIYGLSSLISAVELSYKVVFIISGLLALLISLIWLFSVDRLKQNCLEEQKAEGKREIIENSNNERASKNEGFVFAFCMLALFAVANNFVKEGLTTWMPTILKEKYSLSNSISVFLTLFLPFFAVFGSTFAIFVNKKVKNYILVCGIFYLCSTVFFGIVLILLDYNSWVLPLICFILVACSMSGVNNVITNIFPMMYAKKGNAGTIAGVLDGFCYVGSAITAYGMGSVADNFGWNNVFYIFIGVCALMTVISLIYSSTKRRLKD